MVALFGPSRRDRVQLISTLHSLGPTSVQGVAAALSWSERRTERTIESSVRHGDAAIEFDPLRKTIRLSSARHDPAPEPPRATAPSAELPSAPAAPATAVAPSLPAPSAGLQSPRCPSCHSRLSAAGMPGLYVCSGCGELHHVERGARPPPAPPETPAVAAVAIPKAAPHPAPGTSAGGEDRRSQEMLAAYVTSRPIPCPKCRTGMRHRGVAQYYCPTCGSTVAFDGAGGVSRSAAYAPTPGGSS